MHLVAGTTTGSLLATDAPTDKDLETRPSDPDVGADEFI